MLKGRIRGIYLRGEVYWFGKMVRGRRSIVSLETRDYAEAVQRAREILEQPELQPAQAFAEEVQRFLKHKFETNRLSKASAETKAYVLNRFGEYVKNAPPAHVTAHQCKSFYAAAKDRVAQAQLKATCSRFGRFSIGVSHRTFAGVILRSKFSWIKSITKVERTLLTLT